MKQLTRKQFFKQFAICAIGIGVLTMGVSIVSYKSEKLCLEKLYPHQKLTAEQMASMTRTVERHGGLIQFPMMWIDDEEMMLSRTTPQTLYVYNSDYDMATYYFYNEAEDGEVWEFIKCIERTDNFGFPLNGRKQHEDKSQRFF